MKILKITLPLILVAALASALFYHHSKTSAAQKEATQLIEMLHASHLYTDKYIENLVSNRKSSAKLDTAPKAIDAEHETADSSPESFDAEANPIAVSGIATDAEGTSEIVPEKHLPILMTYSGTWLDQDGEPMSYIDSERFFKSNREYAKAAVAINALCEELQSDLYRYDLEQVHDWAAKSPHDVDEYLAYEWVLDEMPADYDDHLNDLLALIGNQIDLDASPAANIATCIILGKMLEFRDNGTYDASINPHRKHDCEAEGCNLVAATVDTVDTVDTLPDKPAPTSSPVLANLPIASDAMEIIAYLEKQNPNSATQFDRTHPGLYFDQYGRVHGATNPDEECYYATSNGNVYKLSSRTDIDRISQTGEGSLSDVSLYGTYVGYTNRRIK